MTLFSRLRNYLKCELDVGRCHDVTSLLSLNEYDLCHVLEKHNSTRDTLTLGMVMNPQSNTEATRCKEGQNHYLLETPLKKVLKNIGRKEPDVSNS